MIIHYEIGQKLGNCIFLEDIEIKNHHRYCKFQCECGDEFVSSMQKVKSLHTRSCGCIHSKQLSERNTKHGLRHLVEYTLWLNMKQRCNNPNFKYYDNWGGRGITICDRWVNSFENFYEDMGNQPAKRMGIDRINNDLGYFKENCRWATQKTQNNNKRNNLILEYMGKSQSASMWCDELKLNYTIVTKRLRKGVKSISEIFELAKLKTA